MRVWSFIQQKGGVGKTTLCLNLAVAAEARGEKVLVVDLDQQGSAVFWSTTRGTNKPTVIDALPEKIPDILKAAPELGATLCMIDAPSRLDPIALAGVRAADLIVCPTVPDLLNLAPLKETVTLIEAADKLRAAVCVLNNVEEAGAPKKIAHARDVLASFKMAVAPTAVFHHSAVQRRLRQGPRRHRAEARRRQSGGADRGAVGRARQDRPSGRRAAAQRQGEGGPHMTRKTDQGQDRNAWLDRLNPLRRTPQPEPTPRRSPYPTPPSRKNRRVLTTWQDDAALKQLKMLAVELEVSQQSLVAEGINYVLAKYGRPSVAT